MKVKILFISGDVGYCDHCDLAVRAEVKDTEWEEIDDKDFFSLQSYVSIYHKSNYKGERAVLVRWPGPNEVKFSETVKSFLEKRKKEEEARIKEEENRKKKGKEAQEKRELKRLEELKKKYEEKNE